jgi:cytidine deaminase
MDYKTLIEKAIFARDNRSYTPYSHFKVGACVLMEDDSIYSGANIENASYGATNCAERTAIFKAISEGKKKIKAIAIVADQKDIFPCGICRQVIREFSDNAEIIIANDIDDYKTYSIEQLLPNSFNSKDMGVNKDV